MQLVVTWTLSAFKHTVLDTNVRYVLSELKSESLRQTKAPAERSNLPTRFSSLPVTPWQCRDKENGLVVPSALTRWKKESEKNSLCNIPTQTFFCYPPVIRDIKVAMRNTEAALAFWCGESQVDQMPGKPSLRVPICWVKNRVSFDDKRNQVQIPILPSNLSPWLWDGSIFLLIN